MRIVVANDDGIQAPGISLLAGRLAEAGHDVVVVAPAENMSGMSAALGPVEAGELIEVTRMDVCGVPGFAVDAPPALGVFAALQGAFGPSPDVVVSGVNAGLNTGRSVLHSGTVGAALTASTLGVEAMAVSVDVSDPWRFDTACMVALVGLSWLLDNPLAGAVLNLNVPAVASDALRGLRWADLDLFGAVQTSGHDAARGLMFELRSDDLPPVEGSDLALIEAGYATATVLCPVSALDPAKLKPIGASRHVSPRQHATAVTAAPEVTPLEREARPLGVAG